MNSMPLKISIEQPCSQEWKDMSPIEMGRHCQHCAKTVVDFSAMSDSQIIEYIKNKGNTCGRFRNDQLNRNLLPIAHKHPVYLFKTFISLVLISCGLKTENNSSLQSSNKTELVNSIDQNKNPKETVNTKQKSLKGTLFDEDGIIKKFAQIQLQSDSNSYFTDAHGQFKIPIPNEMSEKDLTLEVKQNDSTITQRTISSSELVQALNIHLVHNKVKKISNSGDLYNEQKFTLGWTSTQHQSIPWWQNIFLKKIKLTKIKAEFNK